MLGVEQHYQLPASVPTTVVCLLTLGAAALWVASHAIHRLGLWRWTRPLVAAARVAIGFGTLLLVLQALQRAVLLATNWPLWPLALAGGSAVEAVLALYTLERRTLSPRLGWTMVALRVMLVLAVLAMLAQPVRSLDLGDRTQRCVAVLVDESLSMRICDALMTPAEKVRLAEALGAAPASRHDRLEDVARHLDTLRQGLYQEAEGLEILSSANLETRQKQLASRRSGLSKILKDALQTVNDQLAAVDAVGEGRLALAPSDQATLQDIQAGLKVMVRDHLRDAANITDPAAEGQLGRLHGRLLDEIRKAIAALVEYAPKVEAFGRKIDDIFYLSLSASKRAAIDAEANSTRLELAAALLDHQADANDPHGPRAGLLETLKKKQYQVKAYRFAATPLEMDPQAWLGTLAAGGDANRAAGGEGNRTVAVASSAPASAPATMPTTTPATGPAQASLVADARLLGTDLTAAVRKVLADLPADRLAGVIVLTDGRHNSADPVEPLARRLGLLQIPLCSVVMGSSKPPIDAAIVSVDAPDSVYSTDKVYITADVRLDGLAGREVAVTLYEDANAVDEQKLRPTTDSLRVKVQLTAPAGKAGMRTFKVGVQKFDDEVLATNNEFPLTISVTDDQAQLLLIEGRPRWEFRYIKNLFASRDRSVKLQYVLMEPDQIAGMPEAPKVPAAASQPSGSIEATALPQNESEWMKFDAIILGDVSPAELGPAAQQAIGKFVTERGGTLVVIAGPNHMPRDFAETPLAELLPVRTGPPGAAAAPSALDAFHVALTAEGRENVIMRQAPDPRENEQFWESQPDATWRLPVLETKGGAEVLAYALPANRPSYFLQDPNEKPDDEKLGLRRQYERANPLIALHKASLGQVMFLGYDQTWRLRYRAGDTHHHKFWGGILRWATAGKFAAGSSLVKLGADRARYSPGSHVRARAKILDAGLSPIVSNEVSVNIFCGEKQVLRKALEYQANSPGLYAADLGELPSGVYRMELDAPAAKDVLASENLQKVSCEFSVEPAAAAEQTELSPDRGLMSALAGMTGGAVSDASGAEHLIDSLAGAIRVDHQIKQYSLQDTRIAWPFFALVMLLATVEWILRKKVGLA